MDGMPTTTHRKAKRGRDPDSSVCRPKGVPHRAPATYMRAGTSTLAVGGCSLQCCIAHHSQANRHHSNDCLSATMADLYHLLDTTEVEPAALQSVEPDDDDDGSWNHALPEVPLALQEATRRQQAEEPWTKASFWEEDLKDGGISNQQEEELQQLPYSQLYQAWLHECQAPDVLPYPAAILRDMAQGLARYQGYMDDCAEAQNDDDENENVTALIHSLLRIDAERVKFLVADVLRRRLQKITSAAAAIDTAVLSAAEQALQRDYRAAVDRHLAITVTNHFPQAVWRSLERPVDDDHEKAFCFIRCREDVMIGDALQPAGVCRVVRYQRIRSLLLEGKVELM